MSVGHIRTHNIHCGTKNRTPVTSSNSCTEYNPISVIFGLENRQRVFSLQVSNWPVSMKLGTSLLFYTAITIRIADDAKMGLCKENRILIKKSVWVQRLLSKETDERISDKMIEEDYFERFLRHLKEQCTNARKCVSGRPRTSHTVSKHQRRQRPCSEPGRRSPDASNIATDCQKNRYPSFISRPYNLRRLMSSNVWKTTRAGAVKKRKKIVSTVCYKINLSW